MDRSTAVAFKKAKDLAIQELRNLVRVWGYRGFSMNEVISEILQFDGGDDAIDEEVQEALVAGQADLKRDKHKAEAINMSEPGPDPDESADFRTNMETILEAIRENIKAGKDHHVICDQVANKYDLWDGALQFPVWLCRVVEGEINDWMFEHQGDKPPKGWDSVPGGVEVDNDPDGQS